MSQDEENKSLEYQQALQSLKSLKAEASPFLKTRVLANVRAQEEKPKSLWAWFPHIAGSLASLALVFVVVSQSLVSSTSQGEIVALGTPYMVRADLRSLDSLDPAFVKVELVGNLEFASKKFSKIKQMRSLTLSWERLVGKQYLPVVVQGLETGESHVKIYFYDKDNNLIKTQDFQFDFHKEAS